MKEEILKYVTRHQLTSSMNNTKWREFQAAITSRMDFDPPVMIKDLLLPQPDPGFAPIWWTEFEQEGYAHIEWIKIWPFREEPRGRLIAPEVTDFSPFIKDALESHNIPYEYENKIFTVYGYKATAP